MTKKSDGRKKRDKQAKAKADYAKSNTGWNDLMQAYRSHQNHLNTMARTVVAFFEIENIGHYIPVGQGPYVVGLIRGFSDDVKRFQTRLNDLHAQHKDRTGMVDMEDASAYTYLVSMISAYGQYAEDVNVLLQPVHLQLLGVMQTIENSFARDSVEQHNPIAPEGVPA